MTAEGPAVVEMTEWEPRRLVENATLDAREIALAEQLTEDGRLGIEQHAGGLRISATSWIGVVRFRDVEIRVVPKYAGGDLGVLRMLDYASGIGALADYDALRSLRTAGASLVDLLGWLLADRTDCILRAGMMADYVHRDESIRVLRGRLRFTDQLRLHYGQVDPLECSYDEYETDILENQILAAGLTVARRVCSDAAVNARLTRLRSALEGTCDITGFSAESARAVIEYNRRNEYYRRAHAIAWLFLEHRAIEDIFQGGTTESFVFLLDMNRLFEDFVTQLLREALEPTGVLVFAQRRDRSIIENEDTRRPYSAVIPDILLDDRTRGPRIRLPVDAKYKLYDARRLEPADVYQAFFYAYAYHHAGEHLSDVPAALLMYPTAKAARGAALRVRQVDGASTARIRAIGVDIPRVLIAIEQRLVNQLPEVTEVTDALMRWPVQTLQEPRPSSRAVSP